MSSTSNVKNGPSGCYSRQGSRRQFFKQDDGQVMVFSPLCTHLGCGYHWDAADRKFKCPCHGSVYDVTGQVLAGPASRRLDALLSKVEQGRVLVMYKEFKSGVTGQVEL